MFKRQNISCNIWVRVKTWTEGNPDAFSQMNEKLKSADKTVKCKNKLMVSTVSNR